MTNVVVLIGRLARPAVLRQLPSGDSLVEYQITVPRPGQRAESVPVVWEAPPASATDFGVDDEVPCSAAVLPGRRPHRESHRSSG